MPTSPYPLITDFARKLETATGIGTIGHYYDGAAQDIFLEEGKLRTIVYKLQDGHWRDTGNTEPPVPETISVGNIVSINPNSYYYDATVTKDWVQIKDEDGSLTDGYYKYAGYYEYHYSYTPLPSRFYGKEWVVYEVRGSRVTLFETADRMMSDKFSVNINSVTFLREKLVTPSLEKNPVRVVYDASSAIDNPELGEIDRIRFDHASNGVIYLSIGKKIFQYRYALDLSPILDSWEYGMQSDSPINQFSADVQNISAAIFTDDFSLFQPGSRVSVGFYIGDLPVVSFGETWLDECSYNATEETVSISCRNKSGFFLKDQTMDKSNNYKNIPAIEIIKDLLAVGGITDYEVQETQSDEKNNTHETKSIELKSSSTVLDALNDVIGEFDGYLVLEDWNNKLYIGDEKWMFEHFPNGNFIFDEGKDVFERTTTRSSDSAYVKVMVYSTKNGNKEQNPAVVPVTYYKHWNLGTRKTKHIDAPDGMVEGDIQNYALKKAKELQYSGIKEEITLSLHPEVLVGDIGTVKSGTDAEEGVQLGLITEITHSFSKDQGYRTSIVIDSGGDYTNRDESMYNRAADIFGYNRRQSVLDIVRMTNDGGVSTSINRSSGTGTNAYSMTAETVNMIWDNMEG